MPSRWTVDHVAGSVLAVFALLVLWECRKIPFGSLAEPGPGALPALLAVVLFVCSVAVIAGGRRTEPMRDIGFHDWRHGAAILGTCSFAAAAIESAGYRITIFCGLCFLVKVMERKSWRAAVLFAAAFAAGTHFVFNTLLRVPLPPGPFGL